MKGKVILDVDRVGTGMIKLGFRDASIYPNDGIMWENKGGTVVFKGKGRIGNHSFLSIGEGASVVFGDDFRCSAAMKLVSNFGVEFGQTVSIGWNTLIMDDNMHRIYDMQKQKYRSNGAPITIGAYNWIGTDCKVMPGVEMPERCIFAAGTIILRNSEMRSYCIMGGNPVKVLVENVMREF